MLSFRRLVQWPVLPKAAACMPALLAAGWIVATWLPSPEGDIASPVTRQANDAGQAARIIAARHLMGESRPSTRTDSGRTAVSVPAYRLFGVMTAGLGSSGFALLAADGRPAIAVIEGEEITTGLTLVKVLADGVTVKRDGREETIPLSLGAANPAPSPPPS